MVSSRRRIARIGLCVACLAGVALPIGPALAASANDPAWLYAGSDVPHDPQWTFGILPNGLRYAVRHNGVPPGQVSIRIVADVGSLYETDAQRGYAHLIEHLTFRDSKYLKSGEAIPTWQKLGATFGSDTNAETSPTQTTYKLDLPNASPASIDETFKLLSGMISAPIFTPQGVRTEVPIVLAEMREREGAETHVIEATRAAFFKGQPLADHSPIGRVATLEAATSDSINGTGPTTPSSWWRAMPIRRRWWHRSANGSVTGTAKAPNRPSPILARQRPRLAVRNSPASTRLTRRR